MLLQLGVGQLEGAELWLGVVAGDHIVDDLGQHCQALRQETGDTCRMQISTPQQQQIEA
jgi:hypothetical protein